MVMEDGDLLTTGESLAEEDDEVTLPFFPEETWDVVEFLEEDAGVVTTGAATEVDTTVSTPSFSRKIA